MKMLFRVTIIFFIIINSSYYWEVKIGVIGLPVFICLLFLFISLCIILIYQIIIAIRERFAVKKRNLLISILLTVLTLTFLKPRGIIDFDQLEGKDILIAYREAGGNCQTKLKLKNNEKFIERNYCFGVYEHRGKYEIKGDTIYFKDNSGDYHDNYYEYGIIRRFKDNENKIPGEIQFYYSNDTSWSNFLYLVNNE